MNPRMLSAAALVAGLATSSVSSAGSSDPLAQGLGVSSYELVRLEVPAVPDSNATIRLQVQGQPMTLLVHRHSLRAPDFQVIVQGADGSFSSFDAAEPSTFRGEVAEMPGSRVAASILGGELQAMLSTDSGVWAIQPARLIDPTADPELHVVYRQEDVLPVAGVCGVDDRMAPVPPGGGSTYGTGLKLCEIAFDADVQFFNDNGGSLANTVNDIELVLNNMDMIYQADVDIVYEITTIIVRTAEPDPYTSSDAGTLLDQFVSEWSSNWSSIRRDVAHLMTGRNINGGVIGIAYLNAICSSSIGYGLSESTFTFNLTSRVGLTAHEVGHNFGAGHCNSSSPCWIMCSGLGGCNNDVTQFAPVSVNAINGFANGLGCVPELGDPLPLPFFDGFNVTSIDRDLWPVFQGAVTSTSGIGEPSGGRALNLDAANGTAYGDDFIRSNVILMGGASGQYLSFYSQHRGVESGESLVLEYLNASADWILVDSIVSDGLDQSSFELSEYLLPAGAYHNGFRFRFRTQVSSNDDDWYIDDVRVDDDPTCPVPQLYCVSSPNSFSPNGALMGFTGSSSVAANDMTLLASNAAVNQVGIFYYGPSQTQVAFGNGFRCVGGTTTRLPIISTDLFGFTSYDLDLTNLPPGGGINAGQTTNVQFWFRDPAGGGAAFNLTDGLSVTWCP